MASSEPKFDRPKIVDWELVVGFDEEERAIPVAVHSSLRMLELERGSRPAKDPPGGSLHQHSVWDPAVAAVQQKAA